MTNKDGAIVGWDGKPRELNYSTNFFTENEAKKEIDNCTAFDSYKEMGRDEFDAEVERLDEIERVKRAEEKATQPVEEKKPFDQQTFKIENTATPDYGVGSKVNHGRCGETSTNDLELAVIDFGGYGFEATEGDFFDESSPEDEDPYDYFYDFKFFGDPSKQSLPNVMKVWSDLTDPAIIGDLLTIERAKELIGKKIKVSYHDYNEGTERFKIVGMEECPSQDIGQTKAFTLLTIPLDDGFEVKQLTTESWCYEWQGIFRRGSGAERLFIEKIIE